MRHRFLLALAAVVLAVVTSSCKKNENPNTHTASTDTGTITATATVVDTTPTGGTVATATIVLTDPDKAFILDASAALLAEIEFAHTADGQAQNVAVKAFAHLLVQDLEKENQELKDFAAKHNVDLPVAAAAAQLAVNDTLKALSGKKFDGNSSNRSSPITPS